MASPPASKDVHSSTLSRSPTEQLQNVFIPTRRKSTPPVHKKKTPFHHNFDTSSGSSVHELEESHLARDCNSNVTHVLPGGSSSHVDVTVDVHESKSNVTKTKRYVKESKYSVDSLLKEKQFQGCMPNDDIEVLSSDIVDESSSESSQRKDASSKEIDDILPKSKDDIAKPTEACSTSERKDNHRPMPKQQQSHEDPCDQNAQQTESTSHSKHASFEKGKELILENPQLDADLRNEKSKEQEISRLKRKDSKSELGKEKLVSEEDAQTSLNTITSKDNNKDETKTKRKLSFAKLATSNKEQHNDASNLFELDQVDAPQKNGNAKRRNSKKTNRQKKSKDNKESPEESKQTKSKVSEKTKAKSQTVEKSRHIVEKNEHTKHVETRAITQHNGKNKQADGYLKASDPECNPIKVTKTKSTKRKISTTIAIKTNDSTRGTKTRRKTTKISEAIAIQKDNASDEELSGENSVKFKKAKGSNKRKKKEKKRKCIEDESPDFALSMTKVASSGVSSNATKDKRKTKSQSVQKKIYKSHEAIKVSGMRKSRRISTKEAKTTTCETPKRKRKRTSASDMRTWLNEPGNTTPKSKSSPHVNTTPNGSPDFRFQHRCTYCNYSTKNISHLKVHIRTHTGERPYKCAKCGKTFIQMSALKVHERIHNNSKPYGCDVCSLAFRTSGHLSDHKRIHTGERPYMCIRCRKTFRISTHLRMHLKIHRNEKQYKCDVCDKAFIQSSQLRVHQKIHNREVEAKHACLQCGKKFLLRYNLNFHMRTVHSTGHKPHKCSKCGKGFTVKNYLGRHKKLCSVDIKNRLVECPTCNKKLSKFSIKKHLLTHNAVKRYMCNICGKGFSFSHSLLIHVRVHTKETPHNCPVCDVAFTDLSNMRRHYKVTHRVDPWDKSFKCNECSHFFYSKLVLSRHMKEVHTEERRHVCEDCGKAFKNERNMRQHRLVHNSQSYVQCPQCDQTFAQKGNLRVHISTVHEKVKQFQCEICKVSFATKRNMSNHMRTHTGEKPHQCSVCDKSFAQRSTLRRHEKIHSGERPHKCETCEKTFLQKIHLTLHQKRHEKLYCLGCNTHFKQKIDFRLHFVNICASQTKCLECLATFGDAKEAQVHCMTACTAASGKQESVSKDRTDKLTKRKRKNCRKEGSNTLESSAEDMPAEQSTPTQHATDNSPKRLKNMSPKTKTNISKSAPKDKPIITRETVVKDVDVYEFHDPPTDYCCNAEKRTPEQHVQNDENTHAPLSTVQLRMFDESTANGDGELPMPDSTSLPTQGTNSSTLNNTTDTEEPGNTRAYIEDRSPLTKHDHCTQVIDLSMKSQKRKMNSSSPEPNNNNGPLSKRANMDIPVLHFN